MDGGATPELMLWGIKAEGWAVVLATIVGPIAAVMITRWRDRVTATLDRRTAIFRTLMATRNLTINFDHVAALNQIELEFYGVKNIESAWMAYIRHLDSGLPRDREPTRTERESWDSTRADLLAKLLAVIGKQLGYNMSEIDIRNGGYAPEGWRYRDLRSDAIQEYILDIAASKRSIPVAVYSPPAQSQQDKPARETAGVQ